MRWRYFGRTAAYGQALQLAPGIEATFFDAGHILGSANVLLEHRKQGHARRVLFSGDLGLRGRPILRDPAPPPQADVVVMETTYGDRQHKQLRPSIEELYDAINDTIQRGGNVVIPTFALERAQEILLLSACRQGTGYLARVPAGIPRFAHGDFRHADIPAPPGMLRRTKHVSCFTAAVTRLSFTGLHFTRDTAESMAINRIAGGAVIMAGSGMCTGGSRAPSPQTQPGTGSDNSIVFVGYAAHGTLARRIVDGAETV